MQNTQRQTNKIWTIFIQIQRKTVFCVTKALLQCQTHPVVLCWSANSVSLIPVRTQNGCEISKTLVKTEMKEMLMCFQTLLQSKGSEIKGKPEQTAETLSQSFLWELSDQDWLGKLFVTDTSSHLSKRRKMLFKSSLTCSSSSVTSSLETREMSSTTLCCMARHVLFSSWHTRCFSYMKCISVLNYGIPF